MLNLQKHSVLFYWLYSNSMPYFDITEHLWLTLNSRDGTIVNH